MGGQNGLYLPQRRHGYKLHKIVLWGPLNNEMAKTVTLGSTNPLTVTNLGGGEGTKTDLFTWKTAPVKIVKKHSCSTLNT